MSWRPRVRSRKPARHRRRMGELPQGQANRHRRLRLDAEFGHRYPAGAVWSRREADVSCTKCRAPPSSPRSRPARSTLRVLNEPLVTQGIRDGHLGRADLQCAAGARAIRLDDSQRARRHNREAAATGRTLHARDGERPQGNLFGSVADRGDRQAGIPDHGGRGSDGRGRAHAHGSSCGARTDRSTRKPGRRRKTWRREAGLLKQEVPYGDIIDMRFVKR